MFKFRYNKRYGSDGMHETLSWNKVEDQVTRFKEDIVFSDIISTEISTKSMFEWMSVLPMHQFKPRHFEEDGENSQLMQAKLQLKKSKKNNSASDEEEGDDDS